MHDGRFNTIEEVTDYFRKGGISNPNLDTDVKRLDLILEEKQSARRISQDDHGKPPQNRRTEIAEVNRGFLPAAGGLHPAPLRSEKIVALSNLSQQDQVSIPPKPLFPLYS